MEMAGEQIVPSLSLSFLSVLVLLFFSLSILLLVFATTASAGLRSGLEAEPVAASDGLDIPPSPLACFCPGG